MIIFYEEIVFLFNKRFTYIHFMVVSNSNDISQLYFIDSISVPVKIY